jgi:septal ring factor EnvC (AmiA/AmiB activator)
MDMAELIEKREQLESKRSKLLGKLEAARISLAEIDNRLQELGINPSHLDQEIARLKREQDEKVEAFRTALDEAESIITTIESRLASL